MLLSLFVVVVSGSGPPRSIVYGPPFSPLCRESIESVLLFSFPCSIVLNYRSCSFTCLASRSAQYRVTQYVRKKSAPSMNQLTRISCLGKFSMSVIFCACTAVRKPPRDWQSHAGFCAPSSSLQHSRVSLDFSDSILGFYNDNKLSCFLFITNFIIFSISFQFKIWRIQ